MKKIDEILETILKYTLITITIMFIGAILYSGTKTPIEKATKTFEKSIK